jgi:hypothetical protein
VIASVGPARTLQTGLLAGGAALALRAGAATLWAAAPAPSPTPRAPEPWPDGDERARRRADAEGRALFQKVEPLEFTLTADFRALGKDRKPGSTQRFPATVEVLGEDGQRRAIPVRLSTRGHARLIQNCGFVPLRVEFPRDGVAGTPFAGHGTLKLVTHCHGSKDFEQGMLREYLAYRIYNLFTPRSFRARLARARYVDSRKGEPVATRYAVFLETERDLARRLEGRIREQPKATFRHVDRGTLAPMMLFQYLIGNLDFSIYVQHNVRLVETPEGAIHPVPYDFDYSGLVNAPYAVPPRTMGIKTVLERVYLGPCLSMEEMTPLVGTFAAKKGDLMALVDSIEGLQPDTRREVKDYLGEFYSAVERPKDAKRILVDGCRNKAGM